MSIVHAAAHACYVDVPEGRRGPGVIWECHCGRRWKWVAVGRSQGLPHRGYWRKTWPTRLGLRAHLDG